MPELIEAELYRHAIASTQGHRIVSVRANPEQFLRWGPASGAAVGAVLVGATVGPVRRIGKVVVASLGSVGDLAFRFGMTGRVIVSGHAPIEALVYGPQHDDGRWDRLVIEFDGDVQLRVSDPRRLGSAELDADLSGLGPDAASLSVDELAAAVRSNAAIKAVLLDQNRIAGLGNLLADDALYRAGIAPTRAAHSLTSHDIVGLAEAILATVEVLSGRGGSHQGDLQDQRHDAGRCPLDGTALQRSKVGGRSAYWCPTHQR